MVEQVLTQVTLYWLAEYANTAATAVRYHYSEGHSGAKPESAMDASALPCSLMTSKRFDR